MTVFETSNKKVIYYYGDYQRIKKLIADMLDLKNYLIENKIIKQNKTYVVLHNDKFSYSSSSKLKKVLLRDYITKEQQEIFIDIIEKYYKYSFDQNNNGEFVNVVNAPNPYCLNDLPQFYFSALYRFKKVIKTLIRYELNNKRIKIHELYRPYFFLKIKPTLYCLNI